MKYNLFELLDVAIRMDTPLLLVEGKDDTQIYMRIAQAIGKTIDIKQINTIEDYSNGGCDNVIKAVDKLQDKFEERDDGTNIKRILGVIDRDVRPYRELTESEIDYRQLKGLLVLKYYSIEIYFATKNNLSKIIEKLTYLPSKMITDEILTHVEGKFHEMKHQLYYVSLEALKNACVREYETLVNYGDNSIREGGRLNYLFSQIESKKSELDEFATGKNISINDLKHICKGKWYLYHYINQINEGVKSLAELCKNDQITQCESCKTGNPKECQYKYKQGYQTSGLYNDILEYVDKDECIDIIEKLNELIYPPQSEN